MIETGEYLMKQSGQYQLRSADEQRDLAQRAQRGDADARDQLVLCNLRLVIATMKHFPQFMASNFEDLYQAGVSGLLDSIDHYDSSYGAKFSSYATRWISQSIRIWIFEQNTIYLPRYLHDASIKVYRTMRDGCVNAQEIADRTDLKPSHIEHAMQHLARSYVSLDAPMQDDHSYQEIIADECDDPYAAIAEQSEARWMVEPLLTVLKPRERQAIQLRYGLVGFAQGREMTYPEIAQAMHLSTYCVFHLVRRAIAKMQHAAAGNQEAKAS